MKFPDDTDDIVATSVTVEGPNGSIKIYEDPVRGAVVLWTDQAGHRWHFRADYDAPLHTFRLGALDANAPTGRGALVWSYNDGGDITQAQFEMASTGRVLANGNIQALGNGTFGGNGTFFGDVTVGDDLSVVDDAGIGGDLDVNGTASIFGDLSVAGWLQLGDTNLIMRLRRTAFTTNGSGAATINNALPTGTTPVLAQAIVDNGFGGFRMMGAGTLDANGVSGTVAITGSFANRSGLCSVLYAQ